MRYFSLSFPSQLIAYVNSVFWTNSFLWEMSKLKVIQSLWHLTSFACCILSWVCLNVSINHVSIVPWSKAIEIKPLNSAKTSETEIFRIIQLVETRKIIQPGKLNLSSFELLCLCCSSSGSSSRISLGRSWTYACTH